MYPSKPTLSVITPVFNRSDTIARCIESVLRQESLSYEHIIVDDGSTDTTPAIVSRYASGHSCVRLIRLDANHGVNYARNRGIEDSKGEYVLLLDSDDELLPSAFSTIEQTLHAWSGYQHYLFVPSDLADAFKHHKFLRLDHYELTFNDWLLGTVSGDFVHLLNRKLAGGHKFSEELRTFEALDFIRMHQESGKQLYVNQIVTRRDRRRADAVTREYFLDNRNAMQRYYRYVWMLVTWFRTSCPGYQSPVVLREAKKGIILGIALGKTNDNRTLIEFLAKQSGRSRSWKWLNTPKLQPIAYIAVKTKSKLNRLIR